MSRDAVLRAEDLVAGYTDLNVLNGVSVKVREDEIVALIGPNGSGKSTLLRVVFGVLEAGEGSVKLRGEDVLGKSPDEIVKKGMSYVPQLENVFPTLTVRENLEMGGILLDDPSQRIEEIFDLFPVLEEKKEDHVETLSGGQRKAVAFGRGLMLDPDIILLDEPSAGLSPQLTKDVWKKVKKINRNGTAILVVEQNARQALRISDYGYVLDDGENRYDGKSSELLNDDSVAEMYLGG